MKYNNIIFIGGIHGVGKGTICNNIVNEFIDLVHISASTLLKWDEISTSENKRVEDLGSTQERLIKGLNTTIEEEKTYLLDGHFCLLNKSGVPERIEEKTFRIINPKAIVVVIEDVEIIYQGLVKRDGTIYNIELLEKMQKMEIEYAQYLAAEFRVTYIEISRNDYSELIDFLRANVKE